MIPDEDRVEFAQLAVGAAISVEVVDSRTRLAHSRLYKKTVLDAWINTRCNNPPSPGGRLFSFVVVAVNVVIYHSHTATHAEV